MKLSLGPIRLSASALGCVAALALALSPGLLAGCSSSGDEAAPPGPVAFAADPQAEGAAVFLRGTPAAGDRITFEVVARGVSDLHGSAFRLTYDAASLAFVSAETGTAWSKQAVATAKEGAPGQLAIVWSEKGATGIAATGETVLGRLAFDVRGRKGTPLAFKVERSMLVDRSGAAVPATWRGGAIAAR